MGNKRPTHSRIKENLAHSYACVSKHDQHSNFLAYDLIEIANIAIKKNNTTIEGCEYFLEELHSDILFEFFKLISDPFPRKKSGKTFREEFEAGEVKNLFNYFYSIAKRKVWKAVAGEKSKQGTHVELKELFKEYGEQNVDGEFQC